LRHMYFNTLGLQEQVVT